MVVAGTKDAVLMVESEANGLTEEMLNAVIWSRKFCAYYRNDRRSCKRMQKSAWEVERPSEVKKKLEEVFTEDLKKAFSTIDKQDRSNQISEITEKAKNCMKETKITLI